MLVLALALGMSLGAADPSPSNTEASSDTGVATKSDKTEGGTNWRAIIGGCLGVAFGGWLASMQLRRMRDRR